MLPVIAKLTVQLFFKRLAFLHAKFLFKCSFHIFGKAQLFGQPEPECLQQLVGRQKAIEPAVIVGKLGQLLEKAERMYAVDMEQEFRK